MKRNVTSKAGRVVRGLAGALTALGAAVVASPGAEAIVARLRQRSLRRQGRSGRR
jgi:hypothetical protein